MQMNDLIQSSVGADYTDEQHTPAICRARFIAAIADLSALLEESRSFLDSVPSRISAFWYRTRATALKQ